MRLLAEHIPHCNFKVELIGFSSDVDTLKKNGWICKYYDEVGHVKILHFHNKAEKISVIGVINYFDDVNPNVPIKLGRLNIENATTLQLLEEILIKQSLNVRHISNQVSLEIKPKLELVGNL